MEEISAHGIQARFEFYFLALTFTLVGVALQTADFSGLPGWAMYMEVAAWALLIISGITGLSKVQWLSSIVLVRDRKSMYNNMLSRMNIVQKQGQGTILDTSTGNQMPISEILEQIKAAETRCKGHMECLGKKNEIKHHIQWWSFIAAILLLAVTRAAPAFLA